MSQTPSIKGVFMSGLVDTLNKHVDQGQITPADLERMLEAEDRELLESTVLISHWYPMRAYDRMNTLLVETVGEGDPEFLVARGRNSACELIDSGSLYAQLEYLQRLQVDEVQDPDERFEAFGRDLVVLCSLHNSTTSFGRQYPIPDPDHPRRWICEVTEGEHYPETFALLTKGFVNEMARRYGEPELWVWNRPTPSLVHWRMVRDL